MARLATFGTEGNARAWLQQAFPAADEPKPSFNFRRFLVVFACICAPLLALSTGALVATLVDLLPG